jgi:Phage integrase, N-terminal SAM-like domain
MGTELVKASNHQRTLTNRRSSFILPAIIADQGDKAAERFFTFFTDQIPNKNTREAYYRNVMRFFTWIEAQHLSLTTIKSYHVSAYLAELAASHSTPTVKQHLATLKTLFNWLITGQIIEINPAAASSPCRPISFNARGASFSPASSTIDKARGPILRKAPMTTSSPWRAAVEASRLAKTAVPSLATPLPNRRIAASASSRAIFPRCA